MPAWQPYTIWADCEDCLTLLLLAPTSCSELAEELQTIGRVEDAPVCMLPVLPMLYFHAMGSDMVRATGSALHHGMLPGVLLPLG
jgi:hypothetical protein